MVVLLVAAGIAILSLTHFAPFPFLLDLGGTSVWRVDTGGRKTIFLTFDDGPNPDWTPKLLDKLAEKDVKATFFVIPEHVNDETAPIVRRMAAEGHAIGHHSRRRWFMLKSPSAIAAALQRESDQIQKLTGARPCPVFRPHAGFRSLNLLMGLKRAGYKLAGWSFLSWDWYWFKQRTGPRVAGQVLRSAKPGNIIVIHDSHHKNQRADRKYAVDAAGELIDGLRAQGYEFGNLCDAL